MANLTDFCEKAKTDSFKLSVDNSKTGLSIFTDRIEEKNFTTGEILEYDRTHRYNVTLTTGEKININPSRCGKKIEVSVNSKHLQSDYFTGINKNNIEQALDFICKNINDSSYKLNKYTLLDYGTVTDLDLCYDVEICNGVDSYYLYKYLEMYFENIYSSINYSIMGKQKWDKTGFMLGNRTGSNQSESFPFLKAYHKGKEMLTKSYKFYMSHLSNYDLSLLNRTEVNIRGKGLDNILENRTLSNVLNQNPDYLFERQMLKHFKSTNVTTAEYKKMYANNSEIIIHKLISMITEQDNYFIENPNMLIKELTLALPNKKSKSRYESTLMRIVQNVKNTI
jgi:hypothetical protein